MRLRGLAAPARHAQRLLLDLGVSRALLIAVIWVQLLLISKYGLTGGGDGVSSNAIVSVADDGEYDALRDWSQRHRSKGFWSAEAITTPFATMPLRRLGAADVEAQHAVCELAMLYLGVCFMTPEAALRLGNASHRETFLECIKRIGAQEMRGILPQKCTTTPFFMHLADTQWQDAMQKKLQIAAAVKARAFEVAIKLRDDLFPFARPLRLSDAELSAFDNDTAIQTALKRARHSEQQKSMPRLPRGRFEAAQVYDEGASAPRWIPPAERPGDAFGPPRVCSRTCRHHPIGFGIPFDNIATDVSRTKIWDFLPYIPGPFPYTERKTPSYALSYNDEWLSHTLHRHSLFAFTHKRGGWDCMRHLEILASGALPYFPDIERCPQNTMTHYPKEVFRKVLEMDGVKHIGKVTHADDEVETEFLTKGRYSHHVNFKKPGRVQWGRPGEMNPSQQRAVGVKSLPPLPPLPTMPIPSEESGLSSNARRYAKFDISEYFRLADEALHHTRNFLSTRSVASYILRTIGHEEARRVLMIGRYFYDYLHQTVEHGLGDLGIETFVVGHTDAWTLKIPMDEPPAQATDHAADEADADVSSLDTKGKQRSILTKLLNVASRFEYDPHFDGMPTARIEAERVKRVRKFHPIAGSAWQYGFRSDPRVVHHLNVPRNDSGIIKRILDREFDVIIYSYIYEHERIHEQPFWNEIVRSGIDKSRLVFLHHDDDVWQDPDPGSMAACEVGFVFKREMHDSSCNWWRSMFRR